MKWNPICLLTFSFTVLPPHNYEAIIIEIINLLLQLGKKERMGENWFLISWKNYFLNLWMFIYHHTSFSSFLLIPLAKLKHHRFDPHETLWFHVLCQKIEAKIGGWRKHDSKALNDYEGKYFLCNEILVRAKMMDSPKVWFFEKFISMETISRGKSFSWVILEYFQQ